MREESPGQIGQLFPDTPAGTVRRYWFVGGLGAGILGVGAIQHWGIGYSNIAYILSGAGLLFVLLTVKQRGEWNV